MIPITILCLKRNVSKLCTGAHLKFCFRLLRISSKISAKQVQNKDISVSWQPLPPTTKSCVPCTGLWAQQHFPLECYHPDRASQHRMHWHRTVKYYWCHIYTWEAKQSHRRYYLCGQRGERLTDNWLYQISKLDLGLHVLLLPPPSELHESVELQGKYSENSTSSGIKETFPKLACGTQYQLKNWVSLTLLLEVNRAGKDGWVAGAQSPSLQSRWAQCCPQPHCSSMETPFKFLNLGVRVIEKTNFVSWTNIRFRQFGIMRYMQICKSGLSSFWGLKNSVNSPRFKSFAWIVMAGPFQCWGSSTITKPAPADNHTAWQ